MSAVSIRVIPASSAAWMVAIDWDSSGISLSLFDDIGMAPRPMAETLKGPRERVCMGQNLSRQPDEPTPGQELSGPTWTRGAEVLAGRSAGELAYGRYPLPAEFVHLRTNQRCKLPV